MMNKRKRKKYYKNNVGKLSQNRINKIITQIKEHGIDYARPELILIGLIDKAYTTNGV